jgi:CrcB protein
MIQIIYIGVGGFFGSVARFLLSKFIGRYFFHFPFGTLAVNVLGSLVIGFVGYSIIYGKDLSPELRGLINIGFIGAFTTMSTFAFETTRIFDGGQTTSAILNILANVLLCLGAVVLGRFLAMILVK